ncbi:hypothetical protein TIFTF001_041391 [Ficus carica]|uniref:Uncharacterized protein n=1 Tax=Ficus carica TaxID=3494 RepID=A0AA87ZE21_FICCA|nr:hypothetical protein TIFTF001_041388 [Ficus carica]GMN29989.1 hypothetical protein TIFTF001_041391 [Ficus carica]
MHKVPDNPERTSGRGISTTRDSREISPRKETTKATRGIRIVTPIATSVVRSIRVSAVRGPTLAISVARKGTTREAVLRTHSSSISPIRTETPNTSNYMQSRLHSKVHRLPRVDWRHPSHRLGSTLIQEEMQKRAPPTW